MCTPDLQSTARALFTFWDDQDAQNTAARTNLLPAFNTTATPSRSPDPYASVPITPKLQETLSDEEPDSVVPPELIQQLDDLALARMLTGSAPAVPLSSADIYRLTVGSVDFEAEFPGLFAKKKNRCGTSHAFVEFIKANDSMSFPPTTNCPSGSVLRKLVTTLAAEIKEEYSPPLLAMTLCLVEAISTSAKGPEMHQLFQKAMAADNDNAFIAFEDECAAGTVSSDGIRVDHPANQPGFSRFVQSKNKLVWWSRFATAAMNKICYENIRQLESAFATALADWKKFKISSIQVARNADVDEKNLFDKVISAAAACGESAPTEPQRVSGHLLISLYDVAKKHLDRVITKKEMAKAAITRSFFFTELNVVLRRNDYSILLPASQCDTTIKCCDCVQSFLFTTAEKIKFDAKDPPWSYPRRCKGCAQVNRQKLTALQNGSPATAMAITHQNNPPGEDMKQQESLVGDKSISCQRCAKVFNLTAGQVDWYSKQVDKDGTPWVLPKSCPDCRPRREKHCMMICEFNEDGTYPDEIEPPYSVEDSDSDEPRHGIVLDDTEM